MAWHEDLVRIRISGGWTATTGDLTFLEEFSLGFHLHLDNAGAGLPVDWSTHVDYAASQVASKFATHFGDMQSVMSNRCVFNKVDAYHLDTNGHALDHGMAQINSPSGARGTSTANPLPYEVACAVSLYAYDVGAVGPDLRHRRGRFYLPGGSAGAADTDGRYTTTFRDAVLAFSTSFLNDVQGMHDRPSDPSAHYDLVVAGATGSMTQVERVRVGRVPDAQRRRRNQLDEAYAENDISHE